VRRLSTRCGGSEDRGGKTSGDGPDFVGDLNTPVEIPSRGAKTLLNIV
jgi:hypothetical protein